MAVEFAMNLLSEEDKKLLQNNNHVADCINQAYWKLKSCHEHVFNGDWKVSVKIVENF